MPSEFPWFPKEWQADLACIVCDGVQKNGIDSDHELDHLAATH